MVISGLLAGGGPVCAQTPESSVTTAELSKRTVAIEHIRIRSAKPFADVRAALEMAVPRLDPGIVQALTEGNFERVGQEKAHGPELSIFLIS